MLLLEAQPPEIWFHWSGVESAAAAAAYQIASSRVNRTLGPTGSQPTRLMRPGIQARTLELIAISFYFGHCVLFCFVSGSPDDIDMQAELTILMENNVSELIGRPLPSPVMLKKSRFLSTRIFQNH